MKSTRAYQMTARAEASARTADAILDATMSLLLGKPAVDITLADIAAGAGVTVQTVLRRFGGRDAVFGRAIERFATEVLEQRGSAVGKDLDDVIANLVAHYERWGALMLKMLGEGAAAPAIATALQSGRDYHRTWCREVFAGSLAVLPAGQRARRLGQFVAICDLRTWEILHVDSGLNSAQCRLALREMLKPLVTEGQ